MNNNECYTINQVTDLLKISTKSNPNSIAGAIAALVKESGKVEMQLIGAGALNQAIKAIAIARGFVAPSRQELGGIGAQRSSQSSMPKFPAGVQNTKSFPNGTSC